MTAEQKKEENFWTKDLLEMPTAKFRDWIDNKFQGDQRTLDQIIEKRRKLSGSREERNRWHDENIKPMVASQLVRGAITGPLKAINETVEFGDDIYDYFAGNPYDNNDLIDLSATGLGLEREEDKESWAYTIPQAVTQFLIPMGLASGATRKVITNPWVRGAVAGAVADLVAQDPFEENLFNLMDEHWTLTQPISDLLKAKTEEEIGVAEARLRQVAGGLVIGETLTGLVRGIGVGFRNLPKLDQERILKRLIDNHNTKLVHAASDDIDKFGDEIIPNVPLTKQEINNRINDLEVEWAIHQRDFKREFPDVETVRGLDPNSLPPERLKKFQETVQEGFNLRNEISRLTDELKTAPTGKISERLKENLRNVAQSDARALRETDATLKDATKATGRKILPGTPHPTIPGKVRGYEGRWVTKKHFDQVTESRKGANKIRAQFDQPVQEVAELSQEKAIDLRLFKEGKEDVYFDGAVKVTRASGTVSTLEDMMNPDFIKGSTDLTPVEGGLRGDYDISVSKPSELTAEDLVQFGLTKEEFSKLSTQKQIQVLRDNFNRVKANLPEGTYQLYGDGSQRRSIYARWFKNDPDIEWFSIKDDTPAKPSKDSYAVLTIKDQPPKLDLTTDTRGKGEFYHGAADEFELDASGHFSTDTGIYGQGLYSTDDLTTAGKYQKKNKKIAGKDAKRTIYKVEEKTPIRFYDLDQPLDNKIVDFLRQDTESFADGWVDESLEFIEGEPTLAKLLDSMRKGSQEWNVTRTTFQDYLDDLKVDLSKQGFGGFTHQGGKLAGKGKRLHQVKIYWDPQDQLNINKVDVGGGGAAVPPRKPPSGSGSDVPPVDPTDPKVQTTFNLKFTDQLIIEEAEKIKKADASGQWPLKRTFKDISDKADKTTIEKLIFSATEFNNRFGRTGDIDLPATVVGMNRLLNRSAQELHKLSTLMSQALSSNNLESFKSIRTDFERQIEIIDSLVTLHKPLKTIPAQTLAANKIGGGVADKAATLDDLAKRTPTDKAVNQAVNVRGVADEGGEELIKDETLKELLDLAQKGDKAAIKQLRVLTNRLQALSGNPEGLRRMMAEGLPLKSLRILNEIWINNILSGPPTHAVNILSTGMNTIAKPLDSILGAGSIKFRKDMNIGFKESLFSNRQNLTFNPQFDTTQAMKGAKTLIYLLSSIEDSIKMARAAFLIEDNITDPARMIQDGGSRFAIRHDGNGPVAGLVNFVGGAVRLPGRFLLSEDEFFKSLNFRAYVKASAWENGVNLGKTGKDLEKYIQKEFNKNIEIVNTGSMKNVKSVATAELYEKAKQYAAETTFTSDLQPGSLGNRIQNLASHPVARQFLPFVRTPMNIFKAQVRRTPGVNMLLQEYRQALKSSDPSIAARARGEMLTGGALWSIGMLVAGNIDDDNSEFTFTGGGPKDFDLLNQRKLSDWQPYSFRQILKDKDGNIRMGADGKPRYKYISFKRFEPWASHLMLMADFSSIIGQLHPQDRMDVGTAISTAIGRNLTDKTYLQGITELSYLLSDFDYGQKWLARRAAQTVVPYSGLAKSVSKTLDPRIKDTKPKAGDLRAPLKDKEGNILKDEKGNTRYKEEMLILRQFFNELKATVHGYGDLKPLRNFITGDIIDYPPGYGPDIFNIMNPVTATNSRNHKVLTVLDDVGIIIPKLSDTIAPIQTGRIKLEGGIKLNHDQYAEYIKEISTINSPNTLVMALHEKMQQKEIKVLISTAKGEDITGENQDTSVELRELARDTLDAEFKEIIARYKDAGRKSFLRKNPELLVEYETLRAELKEKFQESSLEKLKQLNGVTN